MVGPLQPFDGFTRLAIIVVTPIETRPATIPDIPATSLTWYQCAAVPVSVLGMRNP